MPKPYNVFISWSGQRSRIVATALRDWLPTVLQAANPWMSDEDIAKGSRGLEAITKALAGMKIGITCLTPENLQAPWLLFEAGALMKALDDRTRLCTYLLAGLESQTVKMPLGMFQATRADREDTRKLVHSINQAVTDEPVKKEYLDNIFDAMWPTLEKTFSGLPPSAALSAPKRSTDDMVAEILEIVRSLPANIAMSHANSNLTFANIRSNLPFDVLSTNFEGSVPTDGVFLLPRGTTYFQAKHPKTSEDDDKNEK